MFDQERSFKYDGGFMGDLDSSTAPGSAKKQGPKRTQSVTPVVIGMLNECAEDEFKIWGSPTHILKIVGIVRKFDVTSTKVTYEIEDHTGRISAILWLEQDNASTSEIPVDKEHIYVNVYGTLRNRDGEKVIMILRIAPITSLNELTTQLLEVIHIRFLSEKLSHSEEISIRTNNAGSELSNSMMSFSHTSGVNAEEDGMNPLQRKVYRIIKSSTSKIGIPVPSIMENFPKNQHHEITLAIDFLACEGHVFSTIDTEHYKATDSAM